MGGGAAGLTLRVRRGLTFRRLAKYGIDLSQEPTVDNTVFKALADPTRRRILRLLGTREMTAGQIGEHFDISAPSMSHHFNLLKEADLVRTRREGQHIYYSLNTTVVQDLLTAIMDLFPSGKPPRKERKR